MTETINEVPDFSKARGPDWRFGRRREPPDAGKESVIHESRNGAFPGGMLQTLCIALAQNISRANFDEVAPQDLIATVPCTLMLIQSGEDHFITTSDAAKLRDIVAARAHPADVIWNIEDSRHVLGMANCCEEYYNRVTDFLQSVTTTTTRASEGILK